MACNTFHLINDSDYGCLGLEQGASLGYQPGRSLTYIVTGSNISSAMLTWTPTGQISSNYADKIPTVYATFTFPSLQYGTFTAFDGTSQTGIAVLPRLTIAQSQAIPVPKQTWTGIDNALVGKNCWLYEIRLVSPDGVTAIDVVSASYVQVVGRVAA